jgi:hypothetical protein
MAATGEPDVSNEENRAARLISRGRTLLEQGQGREAIHVFGRVLLWDPAHEEARRGLREARLAVREADRILDGRLDEAAQALESGDLPLARKLIEDIVERVGDDERALTLLDRTDSREGRLPEAGLPSRTARAVPESGETVKSGPSAWRFTLAASWTVVLAGLTVTIVSGWDRLVSRLTAAPSPRHELPVSTDGFPGSKGERAIAEARHRLEAGDPAGAVAALAQVTPEEPLYPLAVQLRHQVESSLEAGGGSPR